MKGLYMGTKKCVKCLRELHVQSFPKVRGGRRGSNCKKCRYPRLTIKQKFDKKVVKKNDCWDWRGEITRHGYGAMTINGVHTNAHRVSWIIHKGKIPEGLIVCHACDNRSCCNPDHLFLGTHKDNMQDMQKKGRKVTLKGGESNLSKLTETEVKLIVKDLAEGVQNKVISERFGVSPNAISSIRRGVSWSHITRPKSVKKTRTHCIVMTRELVNSIRIDYARGMRLVDLCVKYKRSRSTIDDVVKNRTWLNI